MEFSVSKVLGAGLPGDGRRTLIEFAGKSGESLRLALDPQDRDELLTLLSSLRAKGDDGEDGPSFAGSSAAYRNVQSVEIAADASLTTLLLDFDREQRGRIGVAIPIELARKIGHEIRMTATRTLAAARKQKAS